jgi:hypothetical protein
MYISTILTAVIESESPFVRDSRLLCQKQYLGSFGKTVPTEVRRIIYRDVIPICCEEADSDVPDLVPSLESKVKKTVR